jgi:hypothetical protein
VADPISREVGQRPFFKKSPEAGLLAEDTVARQTGRAGEVPPSGEGKRMSQEFEPQEETA